MASAGYSQGGNPLVVQDSVSMRDPDVPEDILNGVAEAATEEVTSQIQCPLVRTMSQQSDEAKDATAEVDPVSDTVAAQLAADAEMAARLAAEDEQLAAAATAARLPVPVVMQAAQHRIGAAAVVSHFPHLASHLDRAALTLLVAAEGGGEAGHRAAATLALRHKVWQCRNKERLYRSYTKARSEAAMRRWEIPPSWAFRFGLPSRETVTGVQEFNPDDSKRSASSVYDDAPPGEGYHQGMLDSLNGWSAKQNDGEQWYEMDLGDARTIKGVVIQARKTSKGDGWDFVKGFSVQVDGNDVDGGKTFNGFKDQPPVGLKKWLLFSEPLVGQKLRILPKTWAKHISLRVGALLEESTPEETITNMTSTDMVMTDSSHTGYTWLDAVEHVKKSTDSLAEAEGRPPPGPGEYWQKLRGLMGWMLGYKQSRCLECGNGSVKTTVDSPKTDDEKNRQFNLEGRVYVFDCSVCGAKTRWWRSQAPEICINPNNWGRRCGENSDMLVWFAGYIGVGQRYVISVDNDHIWTESFNDQSGEFGQGHVHGNGWTEIIAIGSSLPGSGPGAEMASEHLTERYLTNLWPGEKNAPQRARVDARRSDETGKKTQLQTLVGYACVQGGLDAAGVTDVLRTAQRDYSAGRSITELGATDVVVDEMQVKTLAEALGVDAAAARAALKSARGDANLAAASLLG